MPQLSFLSKFLPLFALFATVLAVQAGCSGQESKKVAGPESEKQCLALATEFKTKTGLEINNTFSQYFGEGSMPSLERLAALYPEGTLPNKTRVNNILSSVGPDVDFKCDAGYGRTNTPAGKRAPSGGMPAFCRFGAYIKTSPLTVVFMEVWMPLQSDPNIPLVPVNTTDFPTNTTSAIPNKDGTLQRVPLYVSKKKFVTIAPGPGSSTPPAPNDVPVVEPTKDETTTGTGGTEVPPKKGAASTDATTDGTTQKETTATETSTDGTTPKTADGKVETVPAPTKRDGESNVIYKKRSPSHPNRSVVHSSGNAIKGDNVIGPGTGWNGRLVANGNGAQRGWVPHPDMKQYMTRYMAAVTGNNGGHWSNAGE
jgi:hypothetical protein